MKVLIGCEMSGRVTAAMLEKGVNAYSCDIIPTIGSCPSQKIQHSLMSPFMARAMAEQWADYLK